MSAGPGVVGGVGCSMVISVNSGGSGSGGVAVSAAMVLNSPAPTSEVSSVPPMNAAVEPSVVAGPSSALVWRFDQAGEAISSAAVGGGRASGTLWWAALGMGTAARCGRARCSTRRPAATQPPGVTRRSVR